MMQPLILQMALIFDTKGKLEFCQGEVTGENRQVFFTERQGQI